MSSSFLLMFSSSPSGCSSRFCIAYQLMFHSPWLFTKLSGGRTCWRSIVLSHAGIIRTGKGGERRREQIISYHQEEDYFDD